MTRRFMIPIAAIAAVVLLSACTSMAQQGTPALIVDPSAEGHAELVRVVSAALNTSTVIIAADALTRESTLLIERTPARDATGQRFSGRDFGKPEHFQLVKDGKRCVLVHRGSGQRIELTKSRCK